MHEKVANQYKDHAHKVPRQLVDRYGFTFEHLNVQGMVKNRHLSKSIADAGWSQLVQFTTYKARSTSSTITTNLVGNVGV
ncbi:hypothetical protein B7C51_05170 [Paenibacillus larvae subsp. pulvifaciens]|uniref:Transposase n=1 Tax=Paenibacillus larvae subsp. pulvifaciens TaxID=1477 RepID=A0A1V0UQD7_9BACL|nr:hypothetical protein B7C51_05170 [Paenibacillus larvae subsp. pulvifaciens]